MQSKLGQCINIFSEDQTKQTKCVRSEGLNEMKEYLPNIQKDLSSVSSITRENVMATWF